MLLGLALGCGGPGESDPRTAARRTAAQEPAQTTPSPASTIVLVTIDTLRSDHLPAYGATGIDTPNLDAVRRDGVLFERAYSPIPLTLPAHASLFTGRLPVDHGVRDNLGYELEVEATTLAERLTEAGYRTGGMVSSFVLRSGTGIAQGFETFDDGVQVRSNAPTSRSTRPGASTVEQARRWLESLDPEDRAFLFVHLYEPHAPYAPPPPFDERYADAPYKGEIATADRDVGVLFETLRALGRYDGAVVVVTSDHGEGLGEHGEDQHGVLLYRESLQIPLLLKKPFGTEAGTSVAVPVQLGDLFPTILEFAGLAASPAEERSGVSLVDPRSLAPERPLFAESFYPELRLGWKGLRSVISGREHYIEGVYGELFDVVEDPGELKELADERRARLRRLQALLQELPDHLHEPTGAIEAEDQAVLQSLGYLSGPTSGGVANRDPRREIADLRRYVSALDRLQAGETSKAVDMLHDIAARQPRFIEALQMLGVAAERDGDLETAYDAYRRAFALNPEVAALLRPLGRTALRLGRPEEALAVLPMAVRAEPDVVEPRALRVQALVALGRLGEALEVARENVRALPRSIDMVYQFGVVRLHRRELREAVGLFEQALEMDAEYVPALSDLGVTYGLLGEWERAEGVLVRLVDLRPRDELARENLDYVSRRARGAG